MIYGCIAALNNNKRILLLLFHGSILPLVVTPGQNSIDTGVVLKDYKSNSTDILMLIMRKDYIVSKIEASQDGSPYVYVAFSDPNDPKPGVGSAGRNFPQSPFGIGLGAIPFTSPEDLMKNLPKAMSNMFGGGGMGMSPDTPTFKISMKEYDDLQLKVGDKVTMEIEKADSIGI